MLKYWPVLNTRYFKVILLLKSQRIQPTKIIIRRYFNEIRIDHDLSRIFIFSTKCTRWPSFESSQHRLAPPFKSRICPNLPQLFNYSYAHFYLSNYTIRRIRYVDIVANYNRNKIFSKNGIIIIQSRLLSKYSHSEWKVIWEWSFID